MVKFLFSLFLFTGSTSYSFSQCCSLGGPMGGDASLGVVKKGSLRVYSIYKYGLSDRYFEGNKETSNVDDTNPLYNVQHSYFDFAGLNLAFGILKKVSLETEWGYFIDKTQYRNETYLYPKTQGYGAGDLALLAKYGLYKNDLRQLELTVGGGAKLPVGSYRQGAPELNISKLSSDLQAGTGAYSIIGVFFAYKGIADKKLKFFLSGRTEINFPNPEQFKYGNIYTGSFFTSYNFARNCNLILQLRNDLKSRDKNFNRTQNIALYSTGYDKLFVVPQFSYAIASKWFLAILADIPVYQYYNEVQMRSAYAFAFTLSREFPVIKEKQKEAAN